MVPKLPRAFAKALVCLPAGLLLAACDQYLNYSRFAETQLSGLHCDAKENQEQSCQAGDVIVTDEGRERAVCDWGWQIIHEPASGEILCVYRGSQRAARPPAGPESVK